ncbi:MAG TPA: sulfatase, partial [Humisphaera sp.]
AVEALEDRRLLSGSAGVEPPAPAGDGPAADAAGRPNFVFVMADDLRYDGIGVVQREQGPAARFPWLRTPNIDRVAAEGVRVRNAFVVSSLSSPARASFLTGRYPHAHGVRDNSTALPADAETYASVLRASGYVTDYVGKWHMGSQAARPGFDHSASYVGQGQYQDATFNVDGVPTATHGWVDDVATDYAVDFLGERRADGRPFALVLGFKSPHVPRQCPDREAGELADVVSAPAASRLAKPPYRLTLGGGPDLASQRDYFRTVQAIDDDVGRLTAALAANGQADDTVFVFVGDNGYLMGEHGLGDKRNAYEESMRFPMLVRYPRRVAAGRTIDPMVLNVDVAPTLLGLAGVAAPAGMQGRSFAGLLPPVTAVDDGGGDPAAADPAASAEPAGWRHSFLYEYYEEAGYPDTPTTFAVRTPTAKLIRYPDNAGWTELFDLSADPYETRNVYNDPAHATLRAAMSAEFDAAAAAVGFTPPTPPAPSAPLKVNFQPASAPTVGGYAVDAGGTFATRNGRAYGWSTSLAAATADRNRNASQLLDTTIGVAAGARWELAVANGRYQVKVAAGDPAVATAATVRVEGVAAMTAAALPANTFLTRTLTVTVADGRLTVDAGAAPAGATRLCYLEVAPATSFATARVNFQPASAPTVGGYLVDAGATFAARNGRTYGWNVSHAATVYDRGRNPDQLLDTCVAVHAGARWELAVPSGTYLVKVTAGDAAAASRNNVWVEGEALFGFVSQAANTFVTRTTTVTVTDGRLTVGVGTATDLATRLAWLEVSAA